MDLQNTAFYVPASHLNKHVDGGTCIFNYVLPGERYAGLYDQERYAFQRKRGTVYMDGGDGSGAADVDGFQEIIGFAAADLT